MATRSIFKVLIAILLLSVLVWVFCLACCELFTAFWGEELMQMQDCPSILRSPEYIKVLTYRKDAAKVYYVEEEMAGGHVLSLEKNDGVWSLKEWNTIWSGVGGSASDVIFPYVWHFIYGGL